MAVTAAATIVAFLNALAFASRLAQTSDSVNGFVAGRAIAGGNVLLSGWHFPIDDYYFTDALPYGGMELLFGSRPFLLVLIPALVYTLFVLAALLVCFDRGKPLVANLLPGAALALLLGAPAWTGQWNPLLLSDMHMATVLCAFGGLVLCARIAQGGRAPWAATSLVIIGCVTMASDPFALVFAFGPAFAILFCEAVARRARGVWLALLLLAAGVLAGSLLSWLIARSGGFTTGNDVLLRPQTLSLLVCNLTAVVMGTLTLFGANPLQGGPGFRGVLLLALRGVGLVLAAAAVLRSLRYCFARNRTPMLDRMLCAGVLTVLAACMASAQFAKGITPQNLWTGGPPMRFLVPAYLFAAALAGRQVSEILSSLSGVWLRNTLAAGAAIATLGGYWLFGLDGRPLWIADNPPAVAAGWLRQHGLFQGVGEYWAANLVTAFSGDAVAVRSVEPDAGRLVPYIWVEDARWYAQPPQFVIWQDDNKTGVTRNQVLATYSVCHIAAVAGYRVAILAGQRGCSETRPDEPKSGYS